MSLVEELPAALAEVRRPGDFSTNGGFDWRAPSLSVEGVGPLALLLLEAQAKQLIGVAEFAPYGPRAEALVDPAVRNCRQIGAERVAISGARRAARGPCARGDPTASSARRTRRATFAESRSVEKICKTLRCSENEGAVRSKLSRSRPRVLMDAVRRFDHGGVVQAETSLPAAIFRLHAVKADYRARSGKNPRHRAKFHYMNPSLALDAHREEIRRIVAANRGLNPRVFGSVLHHQDTESSDLDLLIDAADGFTLFDMAAIAVAIESLVHATLSRMATIPSIC